MHPPFGSPPQKKMTEFNKWDGKKLETHIFLIHFVDFVVHSPDQWFNVRCGAACPERFSFIFRRLLSLCSWEWRRGLKISRPQSISYLLLVTCVSFCILLLPLSSLPRFVKAASIQTRPANTSPNTFGTCQKVATSPCTRTGPPLASFAAAVFSLPPAIAELYQRGRPTHPLWNKAKSQHKPAKAAEDVVLKCVELILSKHLKIIYASSTKRKNNLEVKYVNVGPGFVL